MLDPKLFVDLLFTTAEAVAMGDRKCWSPKPVTELLSGQHEYLSKNPLFSDKDLNPHKHWHHAEQGRRDNKNVERYANFLVEFDGKTIEEQKTLVDVCRLPFATSVWSGNKSIHYIVALSESVTLDQYTKLSSRCHAAINKVAGIPKTADPAVKSPSGLTRCPGALNSKTGQRAELIEVRRRISLAEFESWLQSLGVKETKAEKYQKLSVPLTVSFERRSLFLASYTKDFIDYGALVNFRHHSIYRAAMNCLETGFSFEETLKVLEPGFHKLEAELPRNEFVRIVECARHKYQSTP